MQLEIKRGSEREAARDKERERERKGDGSLIRDLSEAVFLSRPYYQVTRVLFPIWISKHISSVYQVIQGHSSFALNLWSPLLFSNF